MHVLNPGKSSDYFDSLVDERDDSAVSALHAAWVYHTAPNGPLEHLEPMTPLDMLVLYQAAAATFRLLVEAIAESQRAGLIRAGDVEELAVSAWSMVHGFSALVIDGQLDVVAGRSIEDLAASVARDLYLGLGERPIPEPHP